jgi:hypothetical protein
MELWQLEVAIRKQCIWNHDSSRRMQTHQAFEMKAELGMILFIGIAEMYGFDGEDVLNYIDLAPDIYKKRKATFIRAHQEVQKRIASGLPAAQDFKNKIYVKTGLVQNYIRLHYNGEGYITYRDLLK